MYARDPLDRLTQFAVILAPPNHFTLDFTRNAASGIATNTRDNAAYAWAGHYAVNRAYTTDGLNRYSAISSLTPNPAYDGNGNLTSAGGATYTYDVENRLVAATGGVTLTYDPLGRLSQIATAGGATRRFGYDGDALIDEFDGSGNVRRVYVHGPGIDEPMFWWDIPAATWGTLQADERGSIVAVVNNGGAAATINRYDEYGIPAATNAGAFQYTGQVWLPELGMYHYKARIYSPTLGRFLQTDPVAYQGGINLYAYVGNDPLNLVDPSGNDAIMVRNRDGSRTLIIPVRITVGNGTPAQQQATREAIIARVNGLQTDDPTIRVQAVATNHPIEGVLNQLDYSSGYDNVLCNNGVGECVNEMGGNRGHINSDLSDSTSAAAHDILHFAGIRDGYREGRRDASGNRTSTLRRGYTDQDFMARRGGNRLTRVQFDQAERNSSTRKRCESEHGTLIRRCE